jgi:hypothetical protein
VKLHYKIIRNEVYYPEDMSLDAVFILSKLLIKDPKERLGADCSIDTITKHPFFIGIDWLPLQQKRVESPEQPPKRNRKA